MSRPLKPGLASLLGAFGLDVSYHRAAGDHLYYRDDEGNEVEVLDLVGGYGASLLGHNHPELLDTARSEAQLILDDLNAEPDPEAGKEEWQKDLEAKVVEETGADSASSLNLNLIWWR